MDTDGDSVERFKADLRAFRGARSLREFGAKAACSHEAIRKAEKLGDPLPSVTIVLAILSAAEATEVVRTEMVERRAGLARLDGVKSDARSDDKPAVAATDGPPMDSRKESLGAGVKARQSSDISKQVRWHQSPRMPRIAAVTLGSLVVLTLMATIQLMRVDADGGKAPAADPRTTGPLAEGDSTNPPASGTVTDFVPIRTNYLGLRRPMRRYDVKSPSTFYGKTMIAPPEQLWLLLAIPEDVKRKRFAERNGPFVVGTAESIVPTPRGHWHAKLDIGQGECDEGIRYFVLQVAATPRRGRLTEIERRQKIEDYPKFARVPGDSKVLGGVEVILRDYQGGHSNCDETGAGQ